MFSAKNQTGKNIKSKEIILGGNYNIVLIENFPCGNKNELLKRERYFIDNTENAINKNLPTQTLQEWVDKNKDSININQAKYRNNNRDKVRASQKKYYEANKEIINSRKRELRKSATDIKRIIK